MIEQVKTVLRGYFPTLPYLWKKLKRTSHVFKSNEEIFASYYHGNTWEDRDSVSGPGSNLVQTEAIREALPALLSRHGLRALLDVPCGDYYWMSKVDLDVSYVGGDIVEELVAENNATYGDDRVSFQKLDVTRSELPPSDVVLCRDCLVHFSYDDIRRALANIKRSGAEYLLTTTFTDRDRNENIPTGDWRPLNLERAPFDFPPPLDLVDERCEEHGGAFRDKSLGLWRVADLPEVG